MTDTKIIFLNSQSPRSGHNFVAEVLRCIVDCYTPLGLRSELPFAPVIEAYTKARDLNYSSQGTNAFFDSLFIDNIRNTLIKDEKYCLLKYTSFKGATACLKSFPLDFHILSFRDPKDCLFSLFKGMDLTKNDFKSSIKRMLLPSGIYHFLYSRKYASRVLKNMPDHNKFFVVRYEDLVRQDHRVLQELIEYFEVKKSLSELTNQINQIKVINTSFYKEETEGKSIWEATEPTKHFNPINRDKRFNIFQQLGIVWGSNSLRKRMGYV